MVHTPAQRGRSTARTSTCRRRFHSCVCPPGVKSRTRGADVEQSQRIRDCVRSYIILTRAAESVLNRVNLPLLQDNLSVSQFGVLEALLHLGPMSQKELSKKILKSHGNISVVVDNLEKRELVTRTRGAVEDRRVVIVSLTDAGESLVRGALTGVVERVVGEMGILSYAELHDLAATCRKLGLRVDGDEPDDEPDSPLS